MNKPKLSICMIAKNEEGNLQRCLDSLLPIINMKDDKTLEPLTELIVVDTGSTDRTVNVARKFTDKVYEK
ncbi:MAG: glycosyltransferase, partial [Dehalococcoidales bacterium]